MGEAKRRQEELGEKYGEPDLEPIWPGAPVNKGQMKQVYELTTRGAWIGIGGMAVYWVVVRIIGPVFGWWHISS
ncbi:DUF2839 domain-containing protein [Synechococcus sp. PCC 7336]|uniref:DUF2839 domain-containing protein n=1 Tax=Synechococcus sp. PCC 7336 TaxID=195250 RepID=UPI00034DF1F2|nr:DUF2839 domain-containing protein [Synechococcus sp. PCC 7336]